MCSAGVTSLLSPARFIRLYDNPANAEKKKKKKKKKEDEEKKEKNKRRRWREARQEEVKDSREKEFIEAYVSSLQDRGENTSEGIIRISVYILQYGSTYCYI